jgi:hypothetical protein
VTVDDGAGRRAGAAGWPTEQAGSPSKCGAEQSRSLVFFSFPYLTDATKEADTDTVIKNERAQSKGLLSWYIGPTKEGILTNFSLDHIPDRP